MFGRWLISTAVREASWRSAGVAGMEILVGDTIYFRAYDGSSGRELWAHDTSNHSTWQVADIRSGSSSSIPGFMMDMLVGDTIYFDADPGLLGGLVNCGRMIPPTTQLGE